MWNNDVINKTRIIYNSTYIFVNFSRFKRSCTFTLLFSIRNLKSCRMKARWSILKKNTHVITVDPTHNQVATYLLTNYRGTMATRYSGPMNITWFITSLGNWKLLFLHFKTSSRWGLGSHQDFFKILRVA